MRLINGRYHFRILNGGMFWSCWIFGLVMAIVIINLQQLTGSPISFSLIMMVLSTALPVCTILMFANMIAEETELRLFNHLYTLKHSVARIVSERILIVLVSLLLIWVVWLSCAAIVLKTLTAQSVMYMTAVVVPTNLLLGSFVLFAVLLGKNVVAGLVLGFIYWFIEWVGRGWHGPLRLIWNELPSSEAAIKQYGIPLLGLFALVWILLLACTKYLKAWIIRS